jgi:hypothetical protein
MTKIRRYYGSDCNSVDGFNNGYYIDDDCIETSDPMKSCMEALVDLWTLNNDPDDLTELENGYEFIIGYFDKNGKELTRKQYLARDRESDSYRYVYVTFEEVEVSS